MRYSKILALAPALLLAACGGDDEQTITQPQTPGSLIYAYPADGQVGISTKADIVLRFSDAIPDADAAADKIRVSPDDSDSTVSFGIKSIDDGNSLMLKPDQELDPGTHYTITFNEDLNAAGNRTISTPNAIGPDGLQFSTRGSLSGIATLADLNSDPFEVVDSVPNGDDFKFMDFSTIRLRTNQPIHPGSAIYGTTVSLRDGNGELVPATLLVSDNKLAVDPCTTDDPSQCGSPDDKLNPAQTYTLSINGLVNMGGEKVEDYETTFQPQKTGPTEILYQKVVDSNFMEQSVLNGQYVNAVTLNSVLQGKAGPSQQTGALYAELAYAPSFPGDTPLPLRIPRGTVLKSSSLDVKINGSVPILDAETGEPQKTGTIKITMLSDAAGYLYPNPYSDDYEAPRHVRLWMDVSMNTAEAQPNAALSQDLLRVELTGIVIARGGILTIDAIGMVEPNLLGQEYTDSTIAFRIEADTSEQLTAPDRPIDQTGPELVSWMPGPEPIRQDIQRPGDPVVLNFDEPLDPETVADGVSLIGDGTKVSDLLTRLDGTTIAINPEGGLKHGVDYTLSISNELTDPAGNTATPQDLVFALPPIGGSSVTQRPPLALTTYPGYPCETNFDDMNLDQGILGQCYDASDQAVNKPVTKDTLPVSKMPADRPITVVFSQSMDPDSIRLSETFIVEKVTSDQNGKPTGNPETVNGRLEKNNQRIHFYPDEPWDDGAFYRYTMTSQQDPSPTTCQQDEPGSVCGSNGLALKTDLLEGLNAGDGDNDADDLVIYFEGEASQNTVFTPLRNLPVRDTNSNYMIDCDSGLGGEDCLEPFNHKGNQNDGYSPSANAAKLLVDGQIADAGDVLGDVPAKVGCATGSEDCPKKKFIYQTYGLNAEVTGPSIDPKTGEQGIGVLLYPTLLATTSIDVYLDVPPVGSVFSTTGPQILRMRYAKDDPKCADNCDRNSLIPGIITKTEDGPVLKTQADLLVDAPELVSAKVGVTPESNVTLPTTHNLYSYPLTLNLEGSITFFDDGRMQIEQRNTNVPQINVKAVVLGGVTINIPLIIPKNGIYLNFISNSVKQAPGVE